MIKKASKFKDWLTDQRFFRVGWFAKDVSITSEAEEVFSALSDDVANALREATNGLSAHPCETQAALEPIEDAIAQWVENPDSASNSIVILAQPVSPVSIILGKSLSQLEVKEDYQLDVELVDWIERPPHSGDIKEKIEEQLGSIEPDQQQEQTVASQITILPNLCWCFLRSAQGLKGIDYLQDSIMNDNRQFVVIGCGQIGWEYLKSTLKFHAYCDQVVPIPKLTGKQLQDWIEPIVDQFDIRFNEVALHKRLGDPDQLRNINLSIKKPIETLSEITQEAAATAKSSLRSVKEALDGEDDDEADASPAREYFNRLADISDGVSIVALQLFVQSLCYRKVIDPTKDTDQDNIQNRDETDRHEDENKNKAASTEPRIVAQPPKLPSLPELSQSDLYLLYSLMLHGDLTIPSLAESLGDAPQTVSSQVQILRNQGIIEQKDGVIKTNPIHYPRLKRELANNNFIIEMS